MNSRPLDICICTADFAGPIRNGGIGTAYRALSMALTQAGHRVTVFYALGDWSEQGSIGEWVGHYKSLGIELVPAPAPAEAIVNTCPHAVASYKAYQWLSEQEKKNRIFDVVHFHEWRGIGFYSTLAKKQGLNFSRSVLCVGTHSPLMWHQLGMGRHPGSLDDLQADFLERGSVEHADVVVSPSEYLLDWMRGQGWKMAADVLVRQNILSDFVERKALAEIKTSLVSEIVFFGRLEARKGLLLFCDAMDVLCADERFIVAHRDVGITFLGKPTHVPGISIARYLQSRGKSWPLRSRVMDDLDQAGALDYLRKPGRLAVMPSLLENSPYTLLECLGNGIACLCTDLPGNRELIAASPLTPSPCTQGEGGPAVSAVEPGEGSDGAKNPHPNPLPEYMERGQNSQDDRERITFKPTASDLALKLKTAIEQGAKPALPAVDPKETQAAWIRWHGEVAGKYPGPVTPGETPLVSVCIAHRNRPEMLAQAIESIRRQDYPRVQVVLVDDGSDLPAAIAFLSELEAEFAKKGWKIIRQANRYLGAARNAAAKAADGQWLLFMDDDNFAEPDEISTFVRAAICAKADILTCFASCFRESTPPRAGVTARELWLPIGGAVAVGAFANIFGDANGLYRREIFEKLGGFSEDAGVGHEDWEFYAKAALAGYSVMVVPRALFWYREHATSMLRTTNHYANHMRSLRPYFQALGPQLSPAILLAQSIYFSQSTANESAAPLPAQFRDFEKNDPQRLVDDYWDSLSWRVTGFARRAFATVMHIPVPPRPQVNTRREAMNAVDAIRRSISWEATGPLRAAQRMIGAIRYRRNGST